MRTLKFNSHSSKLMHSHLKLTLDKNKASVLMTLIHQWLETNGPEWTVDRLKSLKTWFVQHLAGNTQYSEPWFKLARSSNGSIIPAGPFGSLFSDVLCSKHKHDKKIIKVLSALMVYTGIRLKKPSTKQILKTVGSIQGSALDSKTVEEMKRKGKILKSNLTSQQLTHVKTYKSHKSKGFKFKPVSLNTGKPFTSGKERYLTSFLQGLHVPYVRNYYRENFQDFPSLEEFPQAKPEDLPPTESNILRQPLSGSIVVIQEPGAKARVIANPNAAAQVALFPLHRMLDSILKDMPTDCTHNQESGAIWAHDQLASGKSMFSVDLSGATDNFPISLQLSLLNSLGLKSEAELIKGMASGIWMLHPDLHTDLICGGHQIATTYTRGQPQGLYSSFPLFGLTHNLLVRALCVKLNISVDDSFRILGDDIIINNEELHLEYRAFMKKAGVPISENKSLSSSLLAEFAGYIITENGYYKPAKVPNPTSNTPFENSFYNYLKVVGEEGIKYLPSKVRKLATQVAMLPEELGGLGLNSRGLSYEERSKYFLEKLDDKDEIPKYFSMEGNFIAVLLSNSIPEYCYPMLNWLYDQWSLYEDHCQNIISDSTILANMVSAGIAEPHSLAYQLSSLTGCADGKVLLGNKKCDNTTTRPIRTDFMIWKDRFSEISDVVYNSKGVNLRLHPKPHANKQNKHLK